MIDTRTGMSRRRPGVTKEVVIVARIKIEDLPRDQKVSKEEMKKVMGGTILDWLGSLEAMEADASGHVQPLSTRMGDIPLRRFGGQDLGE